MHSASCSRGTFLILCALWTMAQVSPAGAQGFWERLSGQKPLHKETPCVLDRCLDKVPDASPNLRPGDLEPSERPTSGQFRANEAGSAGPFDFYVLALSWSPAFCSTVESASTKAQCRTGTSPGFVVHGLWPQYEHGFPSDCDRARRVPSSIALSDAQGLFPDPALARYEWQKHGTCSGKSPLAYFGDVRRARDAIRIPEAFLSPHEEQRSSPLDIIRAFTDANPRLRSDMMAVVCTHGVLQEIRICLTKDLRAFRPCPEVRRMSCRASEITVPPMR